MKKLYLNRAKKEIARPKTIRNINKQIVLNYVRDRSPISRADISRETALNRSTVSAIVHALQADGLIKEIGIGTSSGGRKPTLLKLKTGSPVALGIDITESLTTIAVADITGKILIREDFKTLSDADEMSKEIIKRVLKFVEAYPKHKLEIGISVPGITDYTTGKVLYVPYFNWRDWDISRQLSKQTNLKVRIENDANAIALAELWFGGQKFREFKNFISILVCEGIGTGIIFDGQIYRGENGAAGEFGHMIVGENAPVFCSCGSRNCWEALCSEKAIVARHSQFSSEKSEKPKCNNISQIIALAQAGEPNAEKALRETGKFLGIGISNLIAGLSPQAVVISGNITKGWKFISDELHAVAERSVRNGLPPTFLTTSTLGNHPTLMGAISLVLAGKFASA